MYSQHVKNIQALSKINTMEIGITIFYPKKADREKVVIIFYQQIDPKPVSQSSKRPAPRCIILP